jgi:Zn-dependent protease with chaperone function
MRTKTKSAQPDRHSRVRFLGAATGPFLYLLTLLVELTIGASVRWAIVYLALAIVGVFASVGLSGETCAWAAALTPICWSLLGVVLPGRGWVWGRRLGLRRPSSEEHSAIEAAVDVLRNVDPSTGETVTYWVLDSPLPFAAARGEAIVLGRPVIESASLPAVIAHELGHLESLDARLTEALNRLILWGDPLSLSSGEAPRTYEPAQAEDGRGGTPWALLRLIARLSGGSIAIRLFAPAWAAYWRGREYGADAHAAALGQGKELACFLRDQELALDKPAPGLLPERQHPPVALRIDRLEASSWGGSL